MFPKIVQKKMEVKNKLSLKKQFNPGENYSSSTTKITQKKMIEPINVLISSNIELFKKRTNYELMYEAFYISNLFYEMKKTRFYLKDSYFYFLNLEWFNNWKKYVHYDYYMDRNDIKKFMSINSLPFRPNDTNNEKKENYLKNISQNTKKKIFDYFDNIFLSNNANLYPGYINNKKFLVQNRTYLYNHHLENNFNIVDNIRYNVDYIWVTEDIWKYFYCIYGGFEIRRRNLNLNNYDFSLDNNSLKLDNIIILEPRFKTFNLILFHYGRYYSYKIDEPKYLFVSHSDTIYELKKKIKNVLPFLSKYYLDEIHLFYLAQNMNFNNFADYIRNNNKNEMNFPGISVDLFDANLTLDILEEQYLKINESVSNLVLEIPFYIPEKRTKIFLFKYTNNIKSQEENKKSIDYSKSYYDKIIIDINDKDNDFIINENLFLIKKYFYQKYFIDKINKCQKHELNIHLKKIIDNFKDEQINKMFDAEINDLRNNLDLIYDKSFLTTNVPGLYNNEFIYNNNNNENKEKNLINKKRIREKREEYIIDSNDDNDISWNTCGYCAQNLNQNYVLCRFCLKKKYCNSKCRKNDIKNHLVICG